MGNNITYEFDDDHDMDDEDELAEDSDGGAVGLGAVGLGDNGLTFRLEAGMFERISNDIENIMGHLVSTRQQNRLPVIRKKPDLRTFRHTMLYKEIKALCGLPANSKRPSERWSLMRNLQKRENGAHSGGAFTVNQQRRIANLFVPNKKEKRLVSLEAKIFICKFNRDGSKLITACQDSIVRIYDSSKGIYHLKNRIKAKDVNWSIVDIDFSPCGQYFAYSTWSDYFFVVPINGTAEDFQWLDLNTEQNRACIFSLRFSPCGRTLIGGCNNSNIYMCDRETRAVRTVQTLRTSQVDINAVSYISEQDSNVFVSGCNNGLLKLWDTRCLGGGGGGGNSRSSSSSVSTPVGLFVGHLDGITYIDPRNDGNYVLSNSKDQSIKIWDLRKMTPSSKITKHAANLPMLDWDYRWDTVPREYYNPTTLDGDVSIMTYRGHRVTKSLLRAKFSPAFQTGQRYIYTGCGTGRIIIYDVLTGHIKEAIEGHKEIVRDLCWHPVRSEIVSGSWDSHVNLNTFKRNPLLKRSSSEQIHGPLRRSRRIARQNGEIDDEEEEEE